LHGRGPARLIVRDGDFAVEPGVRYSVKPAANKPVDADQTGVLSIPVTLDGQTQVVIGRAAQGQ
jgi:hypothetical protein